MKTILKKLWGNNKRSTDVKQALAKVKLSLMEDLKSKVEDIFNGMQQAGNEAIEHLSQAEQNLDFLQNSIEQAKEARQAKDELLNQVLDLGIDVPQDLENLDTFIEDILLTDDFTAQSDKLKEIKSYINKVSFT